MNPYRTVEALEERVAEYAGAPHAVAVDSCTNAILLSLRYGKEYHNYQFATLPNRTYVGVAYAVVNAGLKLHFSDISWSGAYMLRGTDVIDSARRFRKGMYVKGSLYCLSAHWGKHLKIGRGGFILTDNEKAAEILRRMRFDGRGSGVAPCDDNFTTPGFHCYMLPEEAARGLMLMRYMPAHNEDIPWDDYPDLSKTAFWFNNFGGRNEP